MAHNHEAYDNGTGVREDRPHNEAEVLFRARLLVPLKCRLRHG
jgi:hypothetical protein